MVAVVPGELPLARDLRLGGAAGGTGIEAGDEERPVIALRGQPPLDPRHQADHRVAVGGGAARQLLEREIERNAEDPRLLAQLGGGAAQVGGGNHQMVERGPLGEFRGAGRAVGLGPDHEQRQGAVLFDLPAEAGVGDQRLVRHLAQLVEPVGFGRRIDAGLADRADVVVGPEDVEGKARPLGRGQRRPRPAEAEDAHERAGRVGDDPAGAAALGAGQALAEAARALPAGQPGGEAQPLALDADVPGVHRLERRLGRGEVPRAGGRGRGTGRHGGGAEALADVLDHPVREAQRDPGRVIADQVAVPRPHQHPLADGKAGMIAGAAQGVVLSGLRGGRGSLVRAAQ